MIMNLIVIAFVLGVAYAWMVRGMFSSMLHMLCVLVSGAIAFAVWEPLAVMLINASPERGFFSFLEGIAFGVALIVPFTVSVLLLRAGTDKLISGNIRNSTVVDYAGGGVCGVVTAVISAGILVLGVGNMRLKTDFAGYQPLWYSTDRAAGSGSLVKADSLWVPVDTITSKFYSQLSTGTMSSSEPLAKWYPELELVGFASRVSPDDGSARNAIQPGDFKVRSTYIVGNEDGSSNVSELLVDSNDDDAQKYLDINSERISTGHIAGYVVEFEPGAKERGEKGGQLVVSNGQYRLLIENSDGDTMSVFPIAVISESSSADQYGRWRFDSNDVFITSVGGKSRVEMSFEFLIPAGYEPLAFYAKNMRVLTDSMPDPVEYPTVSQRDQLVLSGAILKGESAGRVLDETNMITYTPGSGSSSFIRASPKISQVISLQVARRGLSMNDENHIVDGEGLFDVKAEVGRQNAPTSKKLRVERLAIARGQTLVRLDVSAASDFGFLSDAAGDAALDQALILIDDKGNEYEAIGYEYTDSKIYQIRYTRGSTLGGVEDTPNLSRTKQDEQELVLFFIVTKNAQISHFTIGDVAIAEFSPAYDSSN
jgi:hypothetical protein